MVGIDWALSVTESTADDSLSGCLYNAVLQCSSIFGLSTPDAQKLLRCVLSIDPNSYSVSCYVSYIRLLGCVLQGCARSGRHSWAFVSLSSGATEQTSGETEQTLISAAVSKIVDIAGWWHRNHFHQEGSAEVLLSQAFQSLLLVFQGASSLGQWEQSVGRLARWCIYNYYYDHMNAALNSAKCLLHVGGKAI